MTATANRGFDMPAHGGAVDTWDTQIVAAFDDLDTMLGGVLSTAVSSSPVTLSTAYKYGVLKFTGTLAANVTVTLPAKACTYTIDNQAVGEAYYLKLTTGSGEAIGIPNGHVTDVYCDGTNVRYRNRPRPGTIEDWGDAAMPAWVGACTVPPVLLCDGATFLIATYPTLAAKLGTTWGGNGSTTSAVPDLRNRVRASLMASSPRLTSAESGINGTTRTAGGAQSIALATAQLPIHTHSGYTSNNLQAITGYTPLYGKFTLVGQGPVSVDLMLRTSTGSDGGGQYGMETIISGTHNHYITTNGGDGVSGGTHINVQPTAVHGITVIWT